VHVSDLILFCVWSQLKFDSCRESSYGRGGGKLGGGGSSDRWRRDDDKTPPVTVNRPGGGPLAARRMRPDHLPEWATEETAGGSFDESGKFRPEENRRNGVR
jgi:hypothetical protein